MNRPVLVETSARHIHVSRRVLDILFGEGYELTKKKDLSQPGQYACEERVQVIGPKGSFPGVSISTLEKDTKLWQLLRPKDWKMFLKGYPRYCINAAIRYFVNGDQPMADNSYARSAFNEYGDIVVRPEVAEDARIFFEGALTVPVITAEEMERMNSFNRYVREQGATMVVTFYAVAMGEYTPAEEEYLQFQNELAQKLDCELISDIRDYFMPYAYFYDTVYHLTDEGTAIRTGQLIEDLQNWLQKPPSQTISP